MYPSIEQNPNTTPFIPHIACISLNPEVEPFCPAQPKISYQGIEIGNVDETFKKDLDPNIAFSSLKSLMLNHPHKVIIAHLNINSISEKFD